MSPALVSENPAGSSGTLVEDASWALKETNLVQLNDAGIRSAARHIHDQLDRDAFSPRTWHENPLHLCPPEPYRPSDPRTKATLDWLFFVSALNFSFWSKRDEAARFGVRWPANVPRAKVWTGYWSLLAAVARAREEDIPLTDPEFYASEKKCPNSLLQHVFRPSDESVRESIPMLQERIAVLREVGSILCSKYDGSYAGLLASWHTRYGPKASALQLVHMVVDSFPSFRDQTRCGRRTVRFWKRAQILVAETWAAFHPSTARVPHPLFPAGVHELTAFADYRVPQILHHLRVLSYPSYLASLLSSCTPLASGSSEEVSIRAGTILGVEKIRDEVRALRKSRRAPFTAEEVGESDEAVCAVLIDFYLWELAKKVEKGDESAQDVRELETEEILPAHRTRSIWY